MAGRQPRILQLPRELRDQIYHDYLWVENGYVYDFDAGKLRMSHTNPLSPIDLALIYTCRLIASEMGGLPLRLNTVHIRTSSSEQARTRAGRWAY
ncbi:hypothetical protein B0T16DRAFT_362056, partial [Cercophora newfieldiana]